MDLQTRLTGPIKAEPAMRRESFEWRASFFQVGSLSLLAAAYRNGICASADAPSTQYSFILPISGGGRMTAEGRSIPFAHAREGNFYSPGRLVTYEFGPSFSSLRVLFPESALAATLLMLTGKGPRGSVRFAPSVGVDAASEPSFVRHLRFVYAEVDRAPDVVGRTAIGLQLAETFLTMLLLTGDHDHRHLFDRPVCPAEPPSIRRVEEYIRARFGQPITLGELVAVSGVSARALHAGFRRYRDSSPMGVVRDRRLEAARSRLETAREIDTVTSIATACGFEHLGRFSLLYRQRFGESPRETLARARARSR